MAFNVDISFRKQEATMRLALPGEDYGSRPLEEILPQLNLLAMQSISGAYKIVGLMSGGSSLDNAKPLRAQGVPARSVLAAVVKVTNPVHAAAAGKAHMPALPPKPVPLPQSVPPLEPPPVPPQQQGSAETHTGQKRGPTPGAPKMDKSAKRIKPPLWETGSKISIDGVDAGARMDKMAKKVEMAGGVPVAGDGAGRGIWCVPCGKMQPLAKAFELYPWNKHVGTEAHKASASMRGALQAAAPQVLEFGSADWLAVRQAEWREMRKSKAAHRAA